MRYWESPSLTEFLRVGLPVSNAKLWSPTTLQLGQKNSPSVHCEGNMAVKVRKLCEIGIAVPI